jgi:hypothetical protein
MAAIPTKVSLQPLSRLRLCKTEASHLSSDKSILVIAYKNFTPLTTSYITCIMLHHRIVGRDAF